MTFAIIIWIACGIGTAVLAASKNRDPFGWFLIGAAGGFIALIVAAGINTRPTIERGVRPAVARAQAGCCRSCGDELDRHAEHGECRTCRSRRHFNVRHGQ